jgi:hypothetical protein
LANPAVPNFRVDNFHRRAVTYIDFTLGSVSKVKPSMDKRTAGSNHMASEMG